MGCKRVASSNKQAASKEQQASNKEQHARTEPKEFGGRKRLWRAPVARHTPNARTNTPSAQPRPQPKVWESRPAACGSIRRARIPMQFEALNNNNNNNTAAATTFTATTAPTATTTASSQTPQLLPASLAPVAPLHQRAHSLPHSTATLQPTPTTSGPGRASSF